MTQAQMFHNPVNGRWAGSGRPAERAVRAVRQGVFAEQSSGPGQQVAQTVDNMNRGRADVAEADSESGQHERVRLFGRIGRYFGVKQTRSGMSLATFSMAVHQPYKDQSGNWVQGTVWLRVVVWEAGQSLSQELRKGARVSVEGKVKTREWFDKQNNPHTTTELVAREVRFLDTPGSGTVQHA
jgi:single-strand DNA-binding protein